MSVPRQRILALMQAQCKVFNTVFNPEGNRLGTKVLRERLKGPSVAAYYPRRIGTFNDLAKLYPEWEGLDIQEWDRQEKIAALKARGKGAPKKKRGPPEHKSKGGKKK
ncbi:mitochondrial 37s ribosomal protein rsm27 [Neofusicoccum parvum]|uniref:Small ribosomal subunit protein mS33 n=3 Tax=Neofusicoccum TaxID=407951 RepID=R1ERL1_BOTPV|nr:putative mitochondrial ribosomal protein of the small subunit protein [Neofusicoccum parvum UCRNP2]GME22935.1 mitochondrial 37s ribosomal protein rsm27 [Neofusicoccum parvum]GME45943.1 mitochondrial 37s ribosomal protein rsm27 [Neofusicoccum parvum]